MKTKLFVPQNIFTKIFLSELNLQDDFHIQFSDTSLISRKLNEDENSIGLIPTMDLLTFKDLFVSSEIGMSFNGLISNSYIHFKDGQESLEELFLKGDVTSNEIILSKLLFKEFYDINVKTTLIKDETLHRNENILIVGDENYQKELFMKGLSFSEEIIELIDSPYVNFIFAGSSENILKDFTNKYKNDFSAEHSEKYEDLLEEFPQSSIDFINVNIQDIVFDFEDQDLEGIKSLLQMPYYHGILKDMIDIKFV